MFMPFAARLAIIKVPQGQSAIALAARSSEQVVLGSAGLRWAAVFSGQLRPLGRSAPVGYLTLYMKVGEDEAQGGG